MDYFALFKFSTFIRITKKLSTFSLLQVIHILWITFQFFHSLKKLSTKLSTFFGLHNILKKMWITRPFFVDNFKKNVDIALVRLFKCVELHNSKLDLTDLHLGSLPPLPSWIEVLYLRHNGLATIQVPKFCKELELDFNNYMVFPKVSDGITQVSVDNNLISRVDSSPSKAMTISIYRNKIW